MVVKTSKLCVPFFPLSHVIFCRLWVSRYRTSLQEKLQLSEEDYQNTVERLKEVQDNQSACVLRNAKVQPQLPYRESRS